MKKILMCMMALVLSTTALGTPTTNNSSKLTVTEIKNSLSPIEKRVRDASVKVITGTGHGTGSLIKYRDMLLVLTAHHVADGVLGQNYLLSSETENVWGILVYKDPLNDMSLLYLQNEFRYSEPMKWRPRSEIVEVGQNITYSGYPSWHSLMTVSYTHLTLPTTPYV